MNKYAKEQFDKIKELKKQIPASDNKEQLEKDILSITEDLKTKAIELFNNPSNIKLFLDNIGKFNNYSHNNILLIFLQKSDATFVAPFQTYKKLGYSVKKNPDSISIIVPRFSTIVQDNRDNTLKYYSSLSDEEKQMYKDKDNDTFTFHHKKLSYFSLGTVFDISDSTMPYEDIREKLHPKVDNENAKEYLNTLEELVKDNGFNLKYKKGIKEDGYCNFQDKEIVIGANQTNLVKFKTLLHEFAHSLAHTNLENNYKEYQNNRNKYETEAESIAYVVSNYFNLNVPEFSEIYLYSWSKNKDFKEIDSSLETICNYSQMIINKINDKMKNKDLDYLIQKSNEIAI